jgi:hypothetical protein
LRSVPDASPKAAIDVLQESSDVVKRLGMVIGESAETYIEVLTKRCEWEESSSKEDLVELEDPGKRDPIFRLFRITPHVPQHDAESIFWLLWFLLARANPVSPLRKAKQHEIDAYREYCLAMFTPQPDFTLDKDSRLKLMFMRNRFYDTLDPSLSHLGKMLSLIWSFVDCPTIIWKRYKASPYHAHVLMKGLLLVEILRLSGTDGIPLDTSRPRRAFEAPIRSAFPPMSYNFITQESSGYLVRRYSPDDEVDITLEQGPPKKRRRLEGPVGTYRRIRRSSESLMELEELERRREGEVDEEWKPWLEICHEAADRLSRENAVAALWFGD